MRSTADGNPALTTAVGFRGTAADQWKSLKGLERRADEGFEVRLPGPHQHPAAAVADNGMHLVCGFDGGSPSQSNFQRRRTQERAEPR